MMARLFQLFSRRRRFADLSDELRSHLEERIDDLVAQGIPCRQAAAQARREFGNLTLTERDSRDVWRWSRFENLLLDARYALRTFRKTPGFTAIAILTLALGIGANTAIFSVINAVLLRDLPFPHASRLLYISTRSIMFDFPNLGLSLPDVADLRSSTSTLEQVLPISYSSSELTGYGTPEHVDTAQVPAEFFATLGVHPLYGREFLPDDLHPGSRAIILSYSLWRDRFAGDPAAIGKTLMLDAQPHTIVGIMPYFAPIDFATDSQILAPFLPSQEDLSHRGNHMFPVLASLKPRATLAETQRELDTISARLASSYPGEDKGWSIHATPLKQYLLGDAATPLVILFCAVGFVLLIACANVSNLFLSRGLARRREFAVRSAMGATRGDLFRQLTVECALIALAGGACALLLAKFALHGLRLALPPGIPRLEALRIDAGVILFAFAASLLAAFLSGLAPAWMNSRLDPYLAIKETGDALRAGSRHNLLRRFLVAGEIGVAFVLLVGATLAIQSFARILRSNLGFHPENLVTMRLDFPHHRFAKPEQAFAFARQILASSRAVPGVTAVSAGMVFPLSDEVAETTFYTDQSFAADPQPLSALGNRIAPDYFRTLGIPLLGGRDFNDADHQNPAAVFIVNETLARKFFGSLDIVGKRLATRVKAGKPLWGEIVGVVGNVRAQDPAAEPKPAVYAPLYQDENPSGMYLLARASPDPMTIVPAIQQRIWSVDKNQPITHIETLTAQIDHIHATPRSQSLLLGVFSALGFILALIGVYGVMSYLVGQQTREIGIRMALGAAPTGILRQVITHGLKLTVAGVVIGITVALALTRFLRSLLFSISATDPPTFAAVAALLTIVAMAACYLPARRAMRVDPIQALRHE